MTPDRRSVLRGAGLAALVMGTGAAAGCGSPDAGAGAPATLAIPASSVPVGGGRILTDARYVVTQPRRGEFRAFVKTCTHQGCPVSSIQGADIVCGCHGSRFSIADGSVLNGPATKPLAAAKATLNGDQVEVSAS